MNNKQVAEKVVNRIIEMINSGASLPWVKPWSNIPRNAVKIVDGYKVVTVAAHAWNRKGVEYKGVNTYLPAGEYITFNQCKAEGGSVKKGASGWPILYWNFIFKNIINADGEEETIKIPVLKYYTVFNVKDCSGIEQKFTGNVHTYKVPIVHYEFDGCNADLNAEAEAIIADYVANAGNGFELKREAVTDEAYYSPAKDYVSVPRREQYKSVAEYYSTMFHELAHSTGHKTRLNRFTGAAACASFGSQEYSKEELVAEATAASFLNSIGLEDGNTFRNSAAYIKGWSEKIKSDPLMFVSAMTKAQAAFDYILGIEADSPETDPENGSKPEETPAVEKPVEAPAAEEKVVIDNKHSRPASAKQQAAAAKRIIKVDENNLKCGFYKLDTPEDEPAVMIVNPYSITMTEAIELPAENDRSGFKDYRKSLIGLYEKFRSAATIEVEEPQIATLKQIIADDKKNRPQKDRKNKPVLFDFGKDKPAVNAAFLLDILTVIGVDNLTVKCSGAMNPIYMNNNGNEAILLPVRKA